MKLSKLDCPDENSLKELRKFLEERRPLVGLDRDAWNHINQHDLVAIRPQQARDFVSRWVLRTLVPLYHEMIGKHFKVSGLHSGAGVTPYSKLRSLQETRKRSSAVEDMLLSQPSSSRLD